MPASRFDAYGVADKLAGLLAEIPGRPWLTMEDAAALFEATLPVIANMLGYPLIHTVPGRRGPRRTLAMYLAEKLAAQPHPRLQLGQLYDVTTERTQVIVRALPRRPEEG